jgi:alkanesulfonate monooxygenase
VSTGQTAVPSARPRSGGLGLFWFLPTNGDSRSNVSLGNAVGSAGSRVGDVGDGRLPDLGYLSLIAQTAEHLGFEGALTPTSSWCEDALVIATALSQRTRNFRFLVAFRPGLQSPTLAAQAAATFQRVSGGRLLLNVVTGGDDAEQRRFGDPLGKIERYARAGEYLQIFRDLWSGDPVTFHGQYLFVDGATIVPSPDPPDIYLGGSSPAAIDIAARFADVYLTWGEPPDQVAEKLDQVRARATAYGRALRYGIRLHVISRPTAAEAWAEADRILAGLSDDDIAAAQAVQRASGSEGQQRMRELHRGQTSGLEVSPNLWAGIGLVRGGAGTALVGSHEDVADRIAEYADLGLEEFVLSGYPHVEEAFHFAEGVIPVLRERGLVDRPARS